MRKQGGAKARRGECPGKSGAAGLQNSIVEKWPRTVVCELCWPIVWGGCLARAVGWEKLLGLLPHTSWHWGSSLRGPTRWESDFSFSFSFIPYPYTIRSPYSQISQIPRSPHPQIRQISRSSSGPCLRSRVSRSPKTTICQESIQNSISDKFFYTKR